MPLKTGLALSLAFACSSVLSASPACVASAERAAQDAAILAPPLA